MSISSRIHDTIEQWQKEWSDRLRGWMASWLLKGVEDTFEDLETKPREGLFLILDELIASPDTPPSIKPVLEKIRGHQSPAWFITILIMIGGMLGATVLSQFTPTLGGLRYWAQRKAELYRLDPMAVITAWRRDPAKYAALFEDLKDLGWDTDRIEALKFYTQAYPALADVIRFYAREAFEPDMIAKYGLDEETPPYEGTLFEKLGVPKEIADLYWIAHWEHASFIQVREMLHRGLLTGSKEVPAEPVGYAGWAARDAEGEREMYQWYRVVEIPPIWRSLLTESLWNVPTRVDVRRWWDMRTISEEEMISIYHRQGYHGKDLENYIRWTKVYVDFPLMMTRFRNGWITEENIREWLRRLEIPEGRITQFIEEKTKPEKPERVASERDLTVTDIIMGIKKDIITREEGIELIMDLGYDREEAEFKVDVRVAAAEGSPETYEEFKDITTKYKIAIGKEEKPMPEELKKAAAEVVRLTKEVESLEAALKEEERGLMEDEALPGAATEKRDELRVSLHRAEAELQRVKTEYDSLVAQWRHGG